MCATVADQHPRARTQRHCVVGKRNRSEEGRLATFSLPFTVPYWHRGSHPTKNPAAASFKSINGVFTHQEQSLWLEGLSCAGVLQPLCQPHSVHIYSTFSLHIDSNRDVEKSPHLSISSPSSLLLCCNPRTLSSFLG